MLGNVFIHVRKEVYMNTNDPNQNMPTLGTVYALHYLYRYSSMLLWKKEYRLPSSHLPSHALTSKSDTVIARGSWLVVQRIGLFSTICFVD